MATKDSAELKFNERYSLGDYSFRIERSSIPGSANDKIEAICTKDGKNARKSIQLPSSTQIQGWYVEADETEATVYIITEGARLDTGPVRVPFSYGSSGTASGLTRGSDPGTIIWTWSCDALTFAYATAKTAYMLFASDSSGTAAHGSYTNSKGDSGSLDIPLSSSFSYNGKTVYYSGSVSSPFGTLSLLSPDCGNGSIVNLSGTNIAAICWIMVYGDPQEVSETKMVGRFAIDLKDAGGDGPGSDWDDPGDWNEDWEEGDPTQTLRLQVIGALSGRHNDPIEDPSYSYIPADKETVKGYGCGGDGGHGGGGGAGASTVVVHKFATNQADNKEIVALAKRHGYGSGGGKGGKGGDGCILVYY